MRKVTIIVPVYNGSAYLPDLFDSLLAQTFKDWVCICVNDGSTDDSLLVLRRYAAADNRIFVIDQANEGCGAARNVAMRLVTTPFVTFADQDDMLHPQAFEIAVRAIESSDIDCLCFDFSRFQNHPDFRYEPIPEAVSRSSRNGTKLITGHRDSWTIFVWRHLFRAEAVREVPFPPVSGGEDQAWMCELSWRNLSWGSIPSVLYANRERADSQSRGVSKRYINSVFDTYEWIRHRASMYGIDRKWLVGFIWHMSIMYSLSILYRAPGKFPYACRRLWRCLFSGY